MGSLGRASCPCQPKGVDKLKFKRRLRLELETTGVPHKAVAIEAGIDPGAFSRMTKDEHDESLHAHHMPAVTRELGSGLMEWLAQQCGGVYQHGAEVGHIEGAPMAMTGMLAHSAGDVVQGILQDISDGQWDEMERAGRLPALRKLHAIVESLIQDAEGHR